MSPSRRIAQALRRAARTEDRAARAQLRLLREMRRAVLAALGEAAGYRLMHLGQLLTAIDREVLRLRPRAEHAARASAQELFLQGTALVDDVVAIVGHTGLHGFSPQLLDAILEVTADQVRAVWTELGSKLKTQVRRAALGVTEPFQAIQQVSRAIRNPKTFGTVETRAGVIIRTEVNRAFSLATQRRMEQSNERLGGGLKKWWLTAEDARVRPDHADAGARYRPGGKPGPIPVKKSFVVGGESLMFPRDPAGSAKQTIQCRCVSVPYVEDVPAQLPKSA